jgi:hypothetical protein
LPIRPTINVDKKVLPQPGMRKQQFDQVSIQLEGQLNDPAFQQAILDHQSVVLLE